MIPYFSATEAVQLRRLTDEAFDLDRRGSGYAVDAAMAIAAWSERTAVDRVERLVIAAERKVTGA